ncbi:MAG: ComEC family competence protein [Chitinophagaceae bacterium]|nr:MAG: ComEC family competence protein [Chitinophagaceae bacterium]
MRRYGKKYWRSAPFVRLLIPLIPGILLGRYLVVPFALLCITGLVALGLLLLFRFLSLATQYRLRWITGLLFNLLLICLAVSRTWLQDLRHQPNWIGHHLQQTTGILVTLQETPVTKANSCKAQAKTEWVHTQKGWLPVQGNLLLYFRKNKLPPDITFGSQLLIQKNLQPITNSGNPGAFDYRQYCAFQGIHHQLFLQDGEYRLLATKGLSCFTRALIRTQTKLLTILRKWIPGKKEQGVAEALLIGYREDLDKDLVQAYSNTGVVHIIAISGLHLGMIYGLLLLLLKPFRKYKAIRIIRPAVLLLVLWGFSYLAGMAPSILRSVVMFSFIIFGESLGRRTQILNTLAASAFCLLIYNPYFLWDVGFQLSYTAVASIVIFRQPIYRSIYLENPLLRNLWQLNAVTLSAQILTLPVVLYYFHQFPNLFLFTNFIAVPLSGFILYGELFLLLVHKFIFVNEFTGKIITFLIHQLNQVIENTHRLPFAVTGNIAFSLAQALLLYGVLIGFALWISTKKPMTLIAALSAFAGIYCMRAISVIEQKQQHKLVVYNIPRMQAMDIIEGRNFLFRGSPLLQDNTRLVNYHLAPARLFWGISQPDQLKHTRISGNLIAGSRKTILVIDRALSGPLPAEKIPVDIIILSGNPRLHLSQLTQRFICAQYIFDSSNPLWKIQYWKKDADSLHLRHHTISEQGAFEVDL